MKANVQSYFLRGLSLICIVVTMLIVSACKKQNFEKHVGPAICASDEFEYVEAPALSSGTVNLNSVPLTITAEFNEEVPWTITITGQTSGAKKTIKGYGSTVDVDWRGNPDSLIFFMAEPCQLSFAVACIDPVILNFTISAVNDFSNFDLLVYDGDGGGTVTTPVFYGTYATHSAQSGGVYTSPQGGNCWCTVGNSGGTPTWYFGGFDMAVTGAAALRNDGSKVYFNAFVNVQGSTESIPVLTIVENGVQRNKNIAVYGDGWHYVSFKLSDIFVDDPTKITSVTFGLNAYPTQGTSGSMCIDFVNFTNDSPFIP